MEDRYFVQNRRANGVERRTADCEGGRRRCQAFGEMSGEENWLCDTEVQNVEDKPWKKEVLRSVEEGMLRLKESGLQKSGEEDRSWV